MVPTLSVDDEEMESDNKYTENRIVDKWIAGDDTQAATRRCRQLTARYRSHPKGDTR